MPTKLEFANDLATWVAGIASVVAAVTGIVAVKLTRKSPTRNDLEKVEANTRNTTAELTSMRTHLANVEEHLRMETQERILREKAEAAHIAIRGQGYEDTEMVLTVNALVESLRIELVNHNGLLTASIECRQVEQGLFHAYVAPELIGKWFERGRALQATNGRELSINAIFPTDIAPVSKKVPVLGYRTFRTRVVGGFGTQVSWLNFEGET